MAHISIKGVSRDLAKVYCILQNYKKKNTSKTLEKRTVDVYNK